mgnify:FL=1
MSAHAQVARSMSEKEFQARVVSTARALGWRGYHTFDSRRSAAGFPDLVLVRRPRSIFRELGKPRLIFSELKREGRQPDPEQAAWLLDLKAIAEECDLVEVHVWTPESYDQIVEVLR